MQDGISQVISLKLFIIELAGEALIALSHTMHHAHLGEYDMEVELTLFLPEEGGRKMGLPFQSDFDGPRLYFDREEWHAVFTLQDREWLHPGETAQIFVNVVSPEYLIRKLFPTNHFSSAKPIAQLEKAVFSLFSILKNMQKRLSNEKKNEMPSVQTPKSHTYYLVGSSLAIGPERTRTKRRSSYYRFLPRDMCVARKLSSQI